MGMPASPPLETLGEVAMTSRKVGTNNRQDSESKRQHYTHGGILKGEGRQALRSNIAQFLIGLNSKYPESDICG